MEKAGHPLLKFYPNASTRTLTQTFGAGNALSCHKTREQFEASILTQVARSLHTRPIDDQTVEGNYCALFNTFLDKTRYDFSDIHHVATQIEALYRLIHSEFLASLPDDTTTPNPRRASFLYLASDEKKTPLFVYKYNRSPEEETREQLFYFLNMTLFDRRNVPPTYRSRLAKFSQGTLQTYVPHIPFSLKLGTDRSAWNPVSVREIAMLHFLTCYQGEKPTAYGVLQESSRFRLISLNGSTILPNEFPTVGQERHPLLLHPATRQILDEPFTPNEITKITNLPTTYLSLLNSYESNDISQQFAFIAYQVLHAAVYRQLERTEKALTLRDLVVISNVSEPGQPTPTRETLFLEINCCPNVDAITSKISAIFDSVVGIKQLATTSQSATSNLYSAPTPTTSQGTDSTTSEGFDFERARKAVWDHYFQTKV